ncbi:stress-associated endoplasmic reticulum protein 2 isoform X1 [Marmota monax]|uniref:stress-associated endoplasmic reticulum protein 2 isoform X1 n=1 Tax=Marmota monax TaxID=9995 RepID=UPI000FFFB42F|nr:stress-associated endoplasmic reticulum protein 2 isoform X1 [Marmota flaviventris]XP_058438577.1 stress-associated endoplasmic reticulum protein 2 isoform X1 [Marmota monax]
MDSLEKTFHQPLTSSSHLSNHSEHKDGHVRRPGHLMLRPPAGGWRTTEAFGGYLWEANRPRGIEKRLRHWFPDHFRLEVRPNCLLTEHLGESVSSSGKDILLFCWRDW